MRPQIEISPLDYEQVLEWEDAKLYCFSLTVDDKTGWRLPTLAELVYIYTRSDIDSSPERYWASDIMDEDFYWTFDFDTRTPESHGFKAKLYVRPVRDIA